MSVESVEFFCERYFPHTKEFTAKGTPKRIMVEVRKMQLKGKFIIHNLYEINFIRKRFFVKWWDTPTLNSCKEVIKRGRWVKEGDYDMEEFRTWLRFYLKDKTEQAIITLLTMAPTNLEREAA
jgi:hypothetical protein